MIIEKKGGGMMMQPPSPRNPDLLHSTLPYYSDSQVSSLSIITIPVKGIRDKVAHVLVIGVCTLGAYLPMITIFDDQITNYHQVSFSPPEELRGVRLPPQTLPYYSERNTLSPQVNFEFVFYALI